MVIFLASICLIACLIQIVLLRNLHSVRWRRAYLCCLLPVGLQVPFITPLLGYVYWKNDYLPSWNMQTLLNCAQEALRVTLLIGLPITFMLFAITIICHMFHFAMKK